MVCIIQHKSAHCDLECIYEQFTHCNCEIEMLTPMLNILALFNIVSVPTRVLFNRLRQKCLFAQYLWDTEIFKSKQFLIYKSCAFQYLCAYYICRIPNITTHICVYTYQLLYFFFFNLWLYKFEKLCFEGP